MHAKPWLYQSFNDGGEYIDLEMILHLKPKAQTVCLSPSSFPQPSLTLQTVHC